MFPKSEKFIIFAVTLFILLVVNTTGFAGYEIERYEAGYRNNLIVFDFDGDPAGNWASGWDVKVYDYATGSDVTDKTVITKGATNAGKANIFVDWNNEDNRWYKIVIFDNTYAVRGIFLSCAVDGKMITPNTQYVSDINLFNNIVSFVPYSENSNNKGQFTYKAIDSSSDASAQSGSVYCSDGITPARYFVVPGNAEYTVNVPHGKYKAYFYNPYLNRTDIKINNDVTVSVNGGEAQTLSSTPYWVSLGEYTLEDGDNTFTFTKDSAANSNRFYAGDLMLIPVSGIEKTPYSAFEVYNVSWANIIDGEDASVSEDITKIDGTETGLCASIEYIAANGPASYISGVEDYTTPDSAHVFTALYDKDKNLITASVEEITFRAKINYGGAMSGEYKRSIIAPNVTQTSKFDLTKYPGVETIKLFIWDNTNKLIPIVKTYTLTSGKNSDNCLYVSTNGSITGDGNFNNPYKSLKQVFGRLKKVGISDEDITVYLRGGTYVLDETVEITPDSFDIGDHTLTIKPYNEEKVIISGGKKAGLWENVNGNIYRTYLGKDIKFRQLYKNGERQTLAREPEVGELFTEKCGISEWKGDRIPIVKNYFADSLDFANQSVLCSKLSTWTNRRYRIMGIDRESSIECDYLIIHDETLQSLQRLTPSLSELQFEATDCFFEGAYEFMDTPGEWAFVDGYLYYYSQDNTDPNDSEFVYPYVNDNLISLVGTSSNKVKNICFEGITFVYSNWTRANEFGLTDIQANTFIPSSDEFVADSQYRKGFKKLRIPAAVHCSYTDNITIKDCIFTHLGGTGITFDEGNKSINIIGNTLIDISGSGIEIGSDNYKSNDDELYPADIFIKNNLVEDVAVEYNGGCGITVFYADGVTVSNNHIKNVPYSGMSLGWGWADNVPVRHRNFTIKGNVVENAMQTLYDGGFIYTPNPINGTNVMEDNYLIGNERTLKSDSQQCGIYFDSASTGWELNNNVIANIPANYMFDANQNSSTIKNLFTNNEGRIVFNNETETHSVNGYYTQENADWSTLYDGLAFEIIKKAGLEHNWEHLEGSNIIELYVPTPTYCLYEGDDSIITNVSLIAHNKSDSVCQANVVFESEGSVISEIKNTSLKIGENRLDFEIETNNFKEFRTYPCEFKVIIAEKVYQIPLYIQFCPNKSLTISVYDTNYNEVEGLWDVSGLPDTRVGSNNGRIPAKAIYTPNIASGLYEVWFYGVPNASNGLNPHNLVVVDKNKTEHITKIPQRTIPAGWNYIGTYELDKNSFVYLHQVGGGILRTSPIAFKNIVK